MLTAVFIIVFMLVLASLMAYLVVGEEGSTSVHYLLVVAVIAFVVVVAISYVALPPAEGMGAATDALS